MKKSCYSDYLSSDPLHQLKIFYRLTNINGLTWVSIWVSMGGEKCFEVGASFSCSCAKELYLGEKRPMVAPNR